ncbi:YmfQ family protein [Caballeronia zhejiangensis]|uniref:YmfQ family protein n=1 Tax=Caballeronia zhejiangensis TaxID=871203 RepID=UPI00158A8318|nr:putative phage tail protein [Caballeronia zhejiangensis]
MAAPNYQASDFASVIHALMPRGLVWPRDPTAVQAQVIAGLGPTWARHTQANNQLLVDAFPATAVEMLPEWESTLNLPDPCAGSSPTLQGRQQQVVARLTNSGGQSVPYFIGYAKTLGYTVTVTEFTPFRVGQQRMGCQLGTQDWAFTWQINSSLNTVAYFATGQSYVGQALASWGNAVLQCELTAIKPAHTYLNFAYH